LRRRLLLCRARATNSLPVPVSPRSSTVESVGATTRTKSRTLSSVWLLPTILRILRLLMRPHLAPANPRNRRGAFL
jgi:hypothetical protein